jgi:uncharacterized protein with FMN-binding domain
MRPYPQSAFVKMCVAALSIAGPPLCGSASAEDKPAGTGGTREPLSLKEALAKLMLPPDWFATTTIRYDTKKPWREARKHIRKLLGGDGASVLEGVKLTCLYRQKNDIGDGHEFPLYLYLGGQHAWAVREYRKRLKAKPQGHTHEYLALSSCYAHFREYDLALAELEAALKRLPPPPWQVAKMADVHDHIGDLRVKMAQEDLARQSYRRAASFYPRSKQPYGRHLLTRKAARVRLKLDRLDIKSLDLASLRTGIYTDSVLGYRGDVAVTIAVAKGRIADIRVKHKEDIEQNATKIVPKRIIDAQGLDVDGVTGATITSDAIILATLKALRKAGLKQDQATSAAPTSR